jgi:predicted nucleic acid-binding Zn ribbon protein
MKTPVTAPQTPVTADSSGRPGTRARRTGPALHKGAGAAPVERECIACGQAFSATRPTAKCCSGRCRVLRSRTRRMAELVERLAAAEAALHAAEQAIKNAAGAVEDLRVLAEQGGPKVAP